MEAASFPSFFHGVYVREAHVPLAIGVEDVIHEAIAFLWAQ